VSQAVLTGESIPIEKYDVLGSVLQKNENTQSDNPQSANILDIDNICFMGTNIVSGTAKAIAVVTGSDTYFGSLAKSIIGTQ